MCECLLPDVMHDLLEGALQYEVKLLHQHCIGQGYFTRKTLNHRITMSDLGYGSENDRPSTIPHNVLYSADYLLKQKGVTKHWAFFILYLYNHSYPDVGAWLLFASHGWRVCSGR